MTGAGGFVGGTIARALIQRGVKVIAHVRSFESAHSLECETVVGDLSSASTFANFPKRAPDIVHAAANSGRNGESYRQLRQDNVVATRNLLAFAEGQRRARIINISSVSVHGTIQESILDYSTRIQRPASYGRTKHAAETLLSESKSVASISLRLPGILGVGVHEHWIGSLVARAMRNDAITYYNSTAPFNNVVHVNDLADFTYRLLEMQAWPNTGAFPLASRDPISILNTVQIIRDALDSKSTLVSLGERPPCFTIDDSHARKHYGYHSSTTRDAITRFTLEVGRGSDLQAHQN